MNQAARRKPGHEQDWVAGEWGWAWPANRRVLYNRASADPDGRPWSERKALVWWDAQAGKWAGHDVPDFVADRPPSYRPPDGATGVAAISGTDPFIMQADGKAWLFSPAGLVDGPLPAHYEPQESPLPNLLYAQQHNPVRQIIAHPEDRFQPSGAEPGSGVFPYVVTTYRLTEHHTAGGMSRFLPYLAELQPAFFCEVSPELAAERGLAHLGWATVISARSAIEARVMVTRRMKPLWAGGQPGAPDRPALALGPERADHRGRGQRAVASGAGPERAHPGGQGAGGRYPARPPAARAGAARPDPVLPGAGRHHRRDGEAGVTMSTHPAKRPVPPAAQRPALDPAAQAGYGEHPPRMGFFTDTSVCIGCKACEVACKEWNHVPEDGLNLLGMSYDNTGGLGASTWRHVAFIEQIARPGDAPRDAAGSSAFSADGSRWLMASNVCKHCTESACLDVCPTGALMRTEFGTVVVQSDVCNGCGYCISACPFGVIDRREGRRPGLEVHAVLRPAGRRPGAGLRQGVPDPVHPVRPGGRAARAGPAAGRRSCRQPGSPGPSCTWTTRPTASAAVARSSCCWTSPRCTGCRRTRW